MEYGNRSAFLTHHRRRIAVLFGLLCLGMVGLTGRLVFLMMYRADHYSEMAEELHQLDHTGEVSLKNGGANWYDSYVNYAVVNGIIEKDYANYTKAQMNAPVTRGEFVHIFHGAEEAYKAINTVADNAIPDVKTTDKFAPEIYEFYRAGILTGSDAKGTFHSASTIKRSEAAAILLRMFEASARKSIILN